MEIFKKGQGGVGCDGYRKVHEYEEGKICSKVPLVGRRSGGSIGLLYLLQGTGQQGNCLLGST